ncbi:two component transcriptional regulator, LytTR family [Emticicia oligotrophica DSM 17448]|uniref:Two component transcriptional regulator, LytTR family n=1 Tax=Emticicia oligotrophica (strain DSM 17448 / CIP 109782 / MTCC 6937 / GPTSA100-15) TaxID=929562 RepID=A0ABM5MY33_EMTOG|nr:MULTISPECIES: LytTR family DNA-binding domain-containing protein [Emticicia]AFK02075.1 two component transcriptional regulator, LytTR family [Emticicia oligotrophica DSM 17448]
MKIVIIEDEVAAASQLKYLLAQTNTSHEVLSVLDSVAESIKWFTSNESPDLIFSDIQLADGISFEIYEQVQIKAPIIFITAFDEYAIRAFKLNSVDYILKPLDLESLAFAIEKFKNQRLIQRDKLNELIQRHAFSQKNYRKSFLVRYREKLLPIKTSDFAYFFIENSLVFGQLFDGRKFILDFKLEDLENQLDSHEFVRANRQYILSRPSITAIESFANSRALVKTNPISSFEIIISKEKVTSFKRWFENG